MANKMTKQFTITKKIAKHGSQSIIIIPRLLEKEICSGKIAKVVIEIIGETKELKGGIK